MITIALEGLPCAGKTTFLNKFITENNSFVLIPELYIEIEKDDTSISIREKYLDAELTKKSKLNNNEINVISDRSFLSTLAFSYAIYKLKGDKGDYTYNLNFLENNRDNIIIPNFIFVFLTTPEESINRRKSLVRGNSQDIFQNQSFLHFFSDFYHTDTFYSIVSKENVIFIDTLVNPQDVTYKLVSKIIENILAN